MYVSLSMLCSRGSVCMHMCVYIVACVWLRRYKGVCAPVFLVCVWLRRSQDVCVPVFVSDCVYICLCVRLRVCMYMIFSFE